MRRSRVTLQSLVHGVLGGLDNAANTIIESPRGRVFKISHSAAKVDGFTIRNGKGDPGGGVLLNSGAVVNCVIRDNRSGGSGGGIAAYTIAPKSIVNCLILNNSAGMGGGIGMGGTGGKDFALLIRNCLIAGNSADGGKDWAGGGGVWVDQGSYAIIESCTIAGNSATHAKGGFGGGVRVRNCNGSCPPVFLTNSIVYGNTATVGNNYYCINNQKGTWLHSCTEPSFEKADASMVFSDPLFEGDGHYTLQQTSPCIDTGKIQAWMMEAKDLAGADRILKVRYAPNVDMGAYEASKEVKDKAPGRSGTAEPNRP